MRPEIIETPPSMYSRSWADPRVLKKVFYFYTSPYKEPLIEEDFIVLSYIPKKIGQQSLTKIMRTRAIEPLYSPFAVRKLATAGYITIELGENDIILVRTKKKCPR
jgi:hypothetical protein